MFVAPLSGWPFVRCRHEWWLCKRNAEQSVEQETPSLTMQFNCLSSIDGGGIRRKVMSEGSERHQVVDGVM